MPLKWSRLTARGHFGAVAVVNKPHAFAVVSPPKVSVTKPVFPVHIYITVVCTPVALHPINRQHLTVLCLLVRTVPRVRHLYRYDTGDPATSRCEVFTAGANTSASSSHLGGKNTERQPSSSLSWLP